MKFFLRYFNYELGVCLETISINSILFFFMILFVLWFSWICVSILFSKGMLFRVYL